MSPDGHTLQFPQATAPDADEEDGTSRKNGDVPSQIALVEVWMGLSGYGMGGDALLKLQKALGMSELVTGDPSEKAGEGCEEEQGRLIPSAVTLEVLYRP